MNKSSLRLRHPIRHLGPHIRHHPQEIIHDVLPLLVAGRFDGLDLVVGILSGVFFGFFVAGCVLFPCVMLAAYWQG